MLCCSLYASQFLFYFCSIQSMTSVTLSSQCSICLALSTSSSPLSATWSHESVCYVETFNSTDKTDSLSIMITKSVIPVESCNVLQSTHKTADRWRRQCCEISVVIMQRALIIGLWPTSTNPVAWWLYEEMQACCTLYFWRRFSTTSQVSDSLSETKTSATSQWQKISSKMNLAALAEIGEPVAQASTQSESDSLATKRQWGPSPLLEITITFICHFWRACPGCEVFISSCCCFSETNWQVEQVFVQSAMSSQRSLHQ